MWILRPVVGARLGRSTRRMDGSPVPQLRNVHARVARTQVIDTPCFVCVLCVEAAVPPTIRNSLRSERNINHYFFKSPFTPPHCRARHLLASRPSDSTLRSLSGGLRGWPPRGVCDRGHRRRRRMAGDPTWALVLPAPARCMFLTCLFCRS